jgi:hypothetical protein
MQNRRKKEPPPGGGSFLAVFLCGGFFWVVLPNQQENCYRYWLRPDMVCMELQSLYSFHTFWTPWDHLGIVILEGMRLFLYKYIYIYWYACKCLCRCQISSGASQKRCAGSIPKWRPSHVWCEWDMVDLTSFLIFFWQPPLFLCVYICGTPSDGMPLTNILRNVSTVRFL